MRIRLALIAFLLLFAGFGSAAQNKGDDVFVPISKYISKGDAESLSAWFDESLEISILAKEVNSSRGQARRTVAGFFETYTPRAFNVTHIAGRPNLKYALGNLNAGGESFLVTIFVCTKDGETRIQQLKIERQ